MTYKAEGVGQVQPMGPWKMNVTQRIRVLPYSHGETLEYFKENNFVLFFFFFKLYIIVLVLPNIKMNPSQVYMCSPS